MGDRAMEDAVRPAGEKDKQYDAKADCEGGAMELEFAFCVWWALARDTD